MNKQERTHLSVVRCRRRVCHGCQDPISPSSPSKLCDERASTIVAVTAAASLKSTSTCCRRALSACRNNGVVSTCTYCNDRVDAKKAHTTLTLCPPSKRALHSATGWRSVRIEQRALSRVRGASASIELHGSATTMC